MLQALAGVISRPGTRVGNWRTQSSRLSNSRPVRASAPLVQPTIQVRFISGNLFGSSSGGKRDGTNLFGSLKSGLPKMPASAPSTSRKSTLSGGKKLKKKSSKEIKSPLAAPDGMGPIKDLGALKKMIEEMPPEALDKLDPDLKTMVDHVREGSLDKMNERHLRRTLEKASKMAHFEISSRGHLQHSGVQSHEAYISQDAVKRDTDLNKLAEETARFMLGMSDQDWKETGIEKPVFSKPISYAKLVELDRILGKRGIKESDFERYMTANELRSGLDDFSADGSKMAKNGEKGSKKLGEKGNEEEEELTHGYTREQLENAPEIKLPKLSRLYPKKAFEHHIKKLAEKKAKKLDQQMKLKPGDLSLALAALTRKKDFQGALAMFQEAMLWEVTVVGFEPIDLLSINTIISIYCSQNNMEMALKTFELLDKYQYAPDQMTFNSFIGVGSVAHDDRISVEWFNKMRESGVKPDLATYCAMISVYAQSGHAKEAEKYFEEMRLAIPNPDSTPYAHMIHMHSVVLNDYSTAIDWAKRMVTDGVPRNEFTAQIVADLHTRVQEQRRTKAKAEQERPKTIQDQFVDAYRLGNSKLVEKLWDSMTYNRAHMPESIWSIMLSYCNDHAKLELATSIFQQMEEQGIPASRITCNTMHQIYRRLGNMELAQSMLERIDSAPRAQASPGTQHETATLPPPANPTRLGTFS